MEQRKVTTGSATGTTGDLKIKPVVSEPSAQPKEFQNFEDLTRKLTQVSKSELDEKREAT
jgi:hypothetical protein